jgi:hypothetical protein
MTEQQKIAANAEARAAQSFAAHAEDNAKAKRALGDLNDDTTKLQHQVESLNAALAEARRRHKTASVQPGVAVHLFHRLDQFGLGLAQHTERQADSESQLFHQLLILLAKVLVRVIRFEMLGSQNSKNKSKNKSSGSKCWAARTVKINLKIKQAERFEKLFHTRMHRSTLRPPAEGVGRGRFT